jgi:hypothetical protein
VAGAEEPNNAPHGQAAALQPLAVVNFENGYAGLIDAFRARAEERRIAITSEEVAQVAGIPSFYLAKVLSPSSKPPRRFGPASLAGILGVLGLRIVLIEDPVAIARFGSRISQRKTAFVRSGTIEFRISRRAFRQMQEKGRKARWDAMTAKQRSAWARKMNRIRWQRGSANGAAVDR